MGVDSQRRVISEFARVTRGRNQIMLEIKKPPNRAGGDHAGIAHGQQHAIGQRPGHAGRSEEHTSELQSRLQLVFRLLLEKKNNLRIRSEENTSELKSRLHLVGRLLHVTQVSFEVMLKCTCRYARSKPRLVRHVGRDTTES